MTTLAATSGSPQTFTAEAVTVTLKKETGDNQSGQMKKELKEPFTVKVTDATCAGVGGVYVSFSVAQKPSGSTGSYPSPSYTYTNADGTASTILTFGDTPGTYTVRATCDQCGDSSPQVFTIEALGIKINLELNKPQVYPSGTSGDSSTTIKVIAEYMDGTPVDDGYPVQISAKTMENGGGHDHTGQRPAGEILGGSCRINSSAGCIEPEISGTTTGGKFEVTYKASKFGGTEKVTAVSKKHPKVESVSKDLTVKVPDLGRFVEYEGIWKLKQPTSIHSDSYWIHNHMYYFLYMIGSEYRNEYPDAETLVITDISLKDGGEFDLGGNWCSRCINPATGKRYGHVSHREGKDVDVRISNIPEDNREDFEAICERYNATAGNHGNHYHIDF